MTVEDLIASRCDFGWPPEMNPLTQAAALQEAQLLDARVQTLTTTVAPLFDLRTALQLHRGDTALLTLRGVTEFRWSGDSVATRRRAWNVVGSDPRSSTAGFWLDLYFFPDARLNLRGLSAEFYICDLRLNPRPPDYGSDDDATINAQLAHWSSSFTPVESAFLDP